MGSSLPLIIATIGYLTSSAVLAVVTIFVLLNNPKRIINRLFFLGASFVTVFGVFFAVAINIDASSPYAFGVWMVSLIDIGMVVFFVHLAFVMVGKEKEAKWIIRGAYAVGVAILVASLTAPHLFITGVEPKLFTKSYLNPGPLFTVMFLYVAGSLGITFATLAKGYLTQKKLRGQIEYFFFTLFVGFGFGSTGFLLVYDIPVSPLFGMLFGLCMIPMAYGIVARELLDIRIVFKKALIYSVIIGLITAFLVILISINDYLASHIWWIKWWTTPIVTAIVAFLIGRLYWRKSIESERLKYEFITVAAHKLRTPLTQISWGVRELLENTTDETVRTSAMHIQRSTNRLIELTNIIFETTTNGASDFDYTYEKIDLRAITREVYAQFKPIADQKNLRIVLGLDDAPLYINADERRIRSVVEVLMENAFNYTPKDGAVEITAYEKGAAAFFSVRDTGIGISPSDKKLIFSRFYRSDPAKRTDTEGVGLGLAMAKSIMEKHKGKIGAISEGEGKGATFWFSLPSK